MERIEKEGQGIVIALIPREIKDKIEEHCEISKIRTNDLVKRALELYLKEHQRSVLVRVH